MARATSGGRLPRPADDRTWTDQEWADRHEMDPERLRAMAERNHPLTYGQIAVLTGLSKSYVQEIARGAEKKIAAALAGSGTL